MISKGFFMKRRPKEWRVPVSFTILPSILEGIDDFAHAERDTRSRIIEKACEYFLAHEDEVKDERARNPKSRDS
jgi:metal-responsive CopG/Arc/MetJ family transcriptional regulator